MPPVNVHPAALPEELLLRDCDVTFGRSSGPGGQHRNKVETAVHIKHRPSGVSAGATERRSRQDNRRVAIGRLRVALAIAVRTERSADDVPSELWRSRCGGDGRIVLSAAHADFPAMLAEAMDVIAVEAYDVQAAGAVLGCSMSQLLKLLRHEPLALERVNRERAEREMHRLK